MTAFSAVDGLGRPPPDVITVPISAFADSWDGKPEYPVKVGLRLIADADIQAARAQAAAYASKLHPDIATSTAAREVWTEAYNDACMRWIVARGTCADDNVAMAFDLWAAAPEDIVRDALTSEGVRFIFDAWERMKVATSPLLPEATQDELDQLWDLLPVGLPTLSADRQARVLRYLRFCLDEVLTP